MQRMVENSPTLAGATALKYILLGDLRELLEQPPDSETAEWLLAVLDALLETLPQEFELKEADGYLSPVLEEYPNWEGLVLQLLAEHKQLNRKLWELRSRVAEKRQIAEIAAEVRDDLRLWMRALHAHQRHEQRLLQTALNLEVGCGD